MSLLIAKGADRSRNQFNEAGRWRAAAQCVQTGSTLLFGDVAGLLAFFQTEHGGQAAAVEVVQGDE